MKNLNIATGLLLSLAASFAQSTPLTTNAPSGYAGVTVDVILHEDAPTDLRNKALEAITLNVTYDASILTYISGVVGDIDPNASGEGLDPLDFLDPTFGGVVSISYNAAVTTGGSLLAMMFQINSGASPGTKTTVDFSCVDWGPPDGCSDYDFKLVQATVTVLQPAVTPIPLPGTFPLMGLAFAALLWTRRQRH